MTHTEQATEASRSRREIDRADRRQTEQSRTNRQRQKIERTIGNSRSQNDIRHREHHSDSVNCDSEITGKRAKSQYRIASSVTASCSFHCSHAIIPIIIPTIINDKISRTAALFPLTASLTTAAAVVVLVTAATAEEPEEAEVTEVTLGKPVAGLEDATAAEDVDDEELE